MSSKDHAWRCVKCLTTDDGREVTDTQKLANLLNKQFTSIFTMEPDSGPPPLLNRTYHLPFLIYINGMVTETRNHLTLCTNNSKLFGTMDNSSLQANLNQVQVWADKWLLSFNISKSVSLHFGRDNRQLQCTMYNSKASLTVLLPTSSSCRDLGVLLDDSLKFHQHTAQAVSKAKANLGLLKRTISSQSSSVFLKLYKAQVRPILGFGTCLAGPFYKSDIQLFEDIQRRSTKCINSLHSQPYYSRFNLSINLLILKEKLLQK